jgi:hypothetical protein
MTYSQTNDGFVFNKDVTFAGNLIPSVSGRFTLGTPGKLWKDLYLGAQTIYIGNTSVSAGSGGGLSVQDQYGNAAAIQLANVGATQYVTVDRVYSNVFPLVEFNSYIGGNVLQFVSNTTGNLYFGIFILGFLISLLWSFNVSKIAVSTINQKITYSLGAGIGAVCGVLITNLFI